MGSPRFTIGIPTYNRAGVLGRAIEAALGQTRADVEVLVCDNASSDATPEVVRSYGDRVRYHRNPENLGAWPNFARLTELARGDYFSWLQDDDLIFPDFARRAADALALAGDVVAYLAFVIDTPSVSAVYRAPLYGPPLALDWVRGGVRLVDGAVVAPLSLFTSVSVPPVQAFRTEAVRAAVRDLRSDCLLFNERIVLSRVALGGRVALDPWVGGVFYNHDDQLCYRAHRDRPETVRAQWVAMARALCGMMESAGEGRWRPAFDSALADLSERDRVRMVCYDAPRADVWAEAHALAAGVREALVRSLPESRLDEVFWASTWDGRENPVKRWARGVTPPALWQALRQARRAVRPAAPPWPGRRGGAGA